MRNLIIWAILTSLVATGCGKGQQTETTETNYATTRQLYFELQWNTLTAPDYPYIDQIEKQVKAVMEKKWRYACDVNIIEILDPRSLNQQQQLEAEYDTIPRLQVEIAWYAPSKK